MITTVMYNYPYAQLTKTEFISTHWSLERKLHNGYVQTQANYQHKKYYNNINNR